MPINTLTFTGQKLEPFNHPEHAERITVKIAASTTLAKGTVLGRITASNLWKAYANGNADGSETARAILEYDVVTDAAGNHFYGQQAASEHGEAHTHVPAYSSGNFKVADLAGLDAAAVTDFGARLLYGDDLADPNAVIHIG